MTGSEIITKALLLLNYTDSSGRADSRISGAAGARGLLLLNQILADVWYAVKEEPFVPLATIEQVPDVGERILCEVVPYGVAMLLAAGEGDGDNQSTFAAIYNQKRAALTHTETRENMLP